jgi:hypothetical protein
MTAMVGLPTLRLIRKRIAGLRLDFDEIPLGSVQAVSGEWLYQALFGEAQDNRSA